MKSEAQIEVGQDTTTTTISQSDREAAAAEALSAAKSAYSSKLSQLGHELVGEPDGIVIQA